MSTRMIKKRASYKFWKEILSYIQSNRNLEDIAFKIYSLLDERRTFGSRANSECSLESLKLALKEFKEFNPSKRNVWIEDEAQK